jgi:hypothetical protein
VHEPECQLVNHVALLQLDSVDTEPMDACNAFTAPSEGVRRSARASGHLLRRIAGLREHNGEVVGDAAWPAIIDRATHDRLVGLLDDPSRRASAPSHIKIPGKRLTGSRRRIAKPGAISCAHARVSLGSKGPVATP